MTFLLESDSIKYILKKFLGEGITCKCYLGQKLSSENSEEFFAIKIFESKYYKFYNNEVNILSKVSDKTLILVQILIKNTNISDKAIVIVYLLALSFFSKYKIVNSTINIPNTNTPLKSNKELNNIFILSTVDK